MVHAYASSPDTVRLSLAIGVAISLWMFERWRVSAGAAVVPGYLALFVTRPLTLSITLVAAVATFGIVQFGIAQRVFLYGRRRLQVTILVGFTVQMALAAASHELAISTAWWLGVGGIGFALPGLIAQDIERQGWELTLGTAGVVTVLTWAILVGAERFKSALRWFGPSLVERPVPQLHVFSVRLLFVAVAISLIVSVIAWERFGLYSGGFVTAGYLALWATQPWHLLFVAASAWVTWAIVHFGLRRFTPVIGRSKFAMTLLVGLAVCWLAESLLSRTVATMPVPLAGFSVIGPTMAALIANDGDRQGFVKTLAVVAWATAAVALAMTGLAWVGIR